MDADKSELQLLKEAMEQAKALYETAKAEHKRALVRMQEFGMAHPDGSIQQPTRVYVYALRAYREALRLYNRYVLDWT